jgi:ADP-ribose pyrophosphatase
MHSAKLPRRISRRKIYESNWIDLYLDQVLMPSGKIISNYHMIESKFDSVVVVMTNDKQDICFIRSPRYATQEVELELPSGGIGLNETISEAAVREVFEETGYILDNPKHIYTFNPSNSMSNQKTHIIIGSCHKTAAERIIDEDEVAEVLWLNVSEIKNQIRNCQIKDGHALISLLYFFSFVNNEIWRN